MSAADTDYVKMLKTASINQLTDETVRLYCSYLRFSYKSIYSVANVLDFS